MWVCTGYFAKLFTVKLVASFALLKSGSGEKHLVGSTVELALDEIKSLGAVDANVLLVVVGVIAIAAVWVLGITV